MNGSEAQKGLFYLPPRVPHPLEVVDFVVVDGARTKVRVRNCVTGNVLDLDVDHELGNEVDEVQVDQFVQEAKLAAAKAQALAAEKKAKAAEKKAKKTAEALAQADPIIGADAPEGESHGDQESDEEG